MRDSPLGNWGRTIYCSWNGCCNKRRLTCGDVIDYFFLVVAGLSNIISAKTTAVLFTPIAVDFGIEVGSVPEVFSVAVIFAVNCSFASPLGFQKKSPCDGTRAL
jgi:hypothetical protein